MDYDRLTEDEFMRLLAAVDARENYNREHQRLENFMTRVQAKQIFGKEAAV